jgi:hypothetical protein
VWLEKIITAILHPITWIATQRIEELGVKLATRRAVFREMVRLHVEQYLQQGGSDVGLDVDRARGVREKVIDQLQHRFDWANVDPEDQIVRSEIAKAVTMAVVPASVWVMLRELRGKEPFDPKHSVMVEYRDGKGSTHHSSTYVAAIQKNFLFFKPFAFGGPSSPTDRPVVSGRLTSEVSTMVDERLKDERVELLRFHISPNAPDPFTMFGRPEAE